MSSMVLVSLGRKVFFKLVSLTPFNLLRLGDSFPSPFSDTLKNKVVINELLSNFMINYILETYAELGQLLFWSYAHEFDILAGFCTSDISLIEGLAWSMNNKSLWELFSIFGLFKAFCLKTSSFLDSVMFIESVPFLTRFTLASSKSKPVSSWAGGL